MMAAVTRAKALRRRGGRRCGMSLPLERTQVRRTTRSSGHLERQDRHDAAPITLDTRLAIYRKLQEMRQFEKRGPTTLFMRQPGQGNESSCRSAWKPLRPDSATCHARR